MEAVSLEKEVILTLVAETSPTQNVTANIKEGTVILAITRHRTAISHIAIIAKKETIVGCITQRDGPTITVAESTLIDTPTLAPGVAVGNRTVKTGGVPDRELTRAVAPPQRKGDLIMTSLVGRENTKQGIWRNLPKTHFPVHTLKVTPQ